MGVCLGTGGRPGSVLRAVELGLPMLLGILGGTAEHWAQYGHAYREACTQVGHPAEAADIAVAVHGFVAENDRQPKATYLEHELRMFAAEMAEIRRPPMAPTRREVNYEAGGMVFAGAPDEVTDRILQFHDLLGHSRQILQMDVGGLPHTTFSRRSNCSVPRSCPRSARSSTSDDGHRNAQRAGLRRLRQHRSSGRRPAPRRRSPRHCLRSQPRKVGVTHQNLRIVQGELTDAVAIAGAVDGADAVINALGPTLKAQCHGHPP